MQRLLIILVWLFLSVTAHLALAEENLPLDGELDADGHALYLTWRDAFKIRVGPIDINRRLLGMQGGKTWAPLVRNLKPVIGYKDTTIEPGIAYEYQVIRKARDIVDVGYWISGTKLPAIQQRGIALVVVDETHDTALAAHLDRFTRDLIGDGWQVIRHSVARHNADREQNLTQARDLRAWVTAQIEKNPQTAHSLILIGAVPIVLSGRSSPDGHDATAQPTDLFYADIGSRWPEGLVGQLRSNFVPDLKVDLHVGRIDFSPLTGRDQTREVQFLKAYFDKNHHWRHGLHGDLRQAYGQNTNLIAEIDQLANILGPKNVTQGGHHDVGETRPWLWGVDFGDRLGGNYLSKYANKAVFAINFGSYKQKFNNRLNPMTAMLAQPWYTVAVGWGGRPTWRLHHMSLGGTIGDVHIRTVNNGTTSGPYREDMDYFPTGKYLWRNNVWINLLGDPTLRAFPLASPRGLRTKQTSAGLVLSWLGSTDPDVIGYHLFHADSDGDTFQQLPNSGLINATSFTVTDPVPNARYMLRAYGLKTVHAGSFYTYSQGIFATPSMAPLHSAHHAISTLSEQSIRLRPDMLKTNGAIVHAFLRGPEAGTLTPDGDDWLYTPPPGFTGKVVLPVSAYAPSGTELGQITVYVTP